MSDCTCACGGVGWRCRSCVNCVLPIAEIVASLPRGSFWEAHDVRYLCTGSKQHNVAAIVPLCGKSIVYTLFVPHTPCNMRCATLFACEARRWWFESHTRTHAAQRCSMHHTLYSGEIATLQHSGSVGCWQRLTVDVARQINEHNIAILIDLVGCAQRCTARWTLPCRMCHGSAIFGTLWPDG